MQPHYRSIQSWKCDPIQRHIPISLLLGSTPPGDWATHSFSAVTRYRTWLVKTQWTFQKYFQCSRFSSFECNAKDFFIISLGAKFTAKLFFIQRALLNCRINRWLHIWPLGKKFRFALPGIPCKNQQVVSNSKIEQIGSQMKE